MDPNPIFRGLRIRIFASDLYPIGKKDMAPGANDNPVRTISALMSYGLKSL